MKNRSDTPTSSTNTRSSTPPLRGDRQRLAPDVSDSLAGFVLFDHDKLAADWVDLDEGVRTDILNVFLKELSIRLDGIFDAIDQCDLVAVLAEAHALKAGAGNVGAQMLSEVSREIELSASQEQFEETQKHSAELMKIAQLTRAAISSYVRKA